MCVCRTPPPPYGGKQGRVTYIFLNRFLVHFKVHPHSHLHALGTHAFPLMTLYGLDMDSQGYLWGNRG